MKPLVSTVKRWHVTGHRRRTGRAAVWDLPVVQSAMYNNLHQPKRLSMQLLHHSTSLPATHRHHSLQAPRARTHQVRPRVGVICRGKAIVHSGGSHAAGCHCLACRHLDRAPRGRGQTRRRSNAHARPCRTGPAGTHSPPRHRGPSTSFSSRPGRAPCHAAQRRTQPRKLD